MTSGKHDDLITDEGVDEGSAASTAEGESSGSGDLQGAPPHGAPTREEDPAGPEPIETPDLAHARDQAPGQELAAGEG